MKAREDKSRCQKYPRTQGAHYPEKDDDAVNEEEAEERRWRDENEMHFRVTQQQNQWIPLGTWLGWLAVFTFTLLTVPLNIY